MFMITIYFEKKNSSTHKEFQRLLFEYIEHF